MPEWLSVFFFLSTLQVSLNIPMALYWYHMIIFLMTEMVKHVFTSIGGRKYFVSGPGWKMAKNEANNMEDGQKFGMFALETLEIWKKGPLHTLTWGWNEDI